ncbi:vitamin K epoxide reductase family protein [Paeniglutamicibacter gangotriensis]|uniref:VKOR family protein n=2 Tax=Paeniglutamicibacter gangotriensis TaxID=254787 RepID=M7N5U4_9MICC|nr:vitamin K epoxide reductase family protein [Paeniglutamicibacter gangotriensis]EMQ97139.1 VKOR family protein [Paeniglutamicibacter gangotriensis Lz1y]KAA0974068.1 vitamin K epoxide reductase family protein [Paeniglutamicibacter gangotriensis]
MSTSDTSMQPRDEATAPRMVRARGFGLLLVLTGAVAWIASGILVLERIALYKNPDYVTSCDFNPWVSCGTVMKSTQAALLGFPNPFLGVVGFGIVITIGMALLAGARFARWYWIGVQIGVSLAMVFIIWLWSQALYEINALCLYCMIVWAMMIPMFLYTTARNIAHGVIPASAAVRRAVAEWTWVATTVLLVLTAASIVLRFPGAFFGA